MSADDRSAYSRRLHFAEKVQDTFSFLSDQGYTATLVEDTRVQFSNHVVILTIYHGRRSFEVGVEVELSARPGTSFSLSTVARAFGGSFGPPPFGQTFGTSESEIDLALTKYSTFLQGVGAIILTGDSAAFERVKEQGRQNALCLERGVRYRQTLPKAEQAFRARDYEKAAELFGKIEPDLSKAELAKLAYSRKQFSR